MPGLIRPAPLGVVSALVLAACAGTSPSEPAAAGSTPPPATEVDGHAEEPDPVAAAPGGSGCAPGTPGSLPDGVWFGFLVGGDDVEVEFDLACWYDGDDAWIIGAERGEPDPPNDVFIVNDNPALRVLPVAPDAWASRLGEEGDVFDISDDEYIDTDAGINADLCPGEFCSVWLTVDGGQVASLDEHFIP